MGLVIDKLTGQVYLFNVTGGGGGATTGMTTPYQEVNVYSELPNPALSNGKIYIVRQPSGSYLINRKDAGLYYSNGIYWTRLGDTPSYFNDDNFQVYDGTDNTKKVRFQLSGLTSNSLRTITMRNSDGVLAYLSDIGSKVDASIFNTYTGVTAPTQFVGIGVFSFYTGQTQIALNNKQDKIWTIQITNTGITNVNNVIPTKIGWNVLNIYDSDFYLFSGGSRIYFKENGTFEVSYHLVTVNMDASEKVIGTTIKKNNNVEIIPNNVPVYVGRVINYGGSNNISKYKFTALMGDYVELCAYRIGESGVVNTVPFSSWIKVEKL
jgi:hypothetical protein